MEKLLLTICHFTLLVLFTVNTSASSFFFQNVKDSLEKNKLSVYYPKLLLQPGGKSLMIPSGWGASGYSIFIGAGGAFRQVYAKIPDGAAFMGIGLGNAHKTIGIQVSANMNDVSEADNWSYSLKLHKYIGNATSVAIGGEHLFYNVEESDATSSYYISLSHALQNTPTLISGVSRWNFNIGIGIGRYSFKSPFDAANGKGERGTAIFGGISYQLFSNTNIILEWSGVNLNFGIASQPFKRIPISISLGLVDLTPNSGDGIRAIGSSSISHKF